MHVHQNAIFMCAPALPYVAACLAVSLDTHSKIQYNRRRDKDVNLSLKEEGWLVLRFWESDIETDIGRVVEAVREALYRRRDSK